MLRGFPPSFNHFFFHFIFVGHYFRSLSLSRFLSRSFPRCILRWPDLHVSKIAKNRSSKFHLSVNSAFEQVLAGVNKQHGSNWIYPPIQQVLRCLHTAPKGAYEARAVTFELWDAQKNLLAGDVGVIVGGVYTSFSGFYVKDGVGTIQILAMAKLLEKSGFSFLDLGQFIEYKKGLGSVVIPRAEFLTAYHSARVKPSPQLSSSTLWLCSDLIR